MAKDEIILNNAEMEQQLIRQRVVVIIVLIALLLTLFVGRIFYLQFNKHEHFTTLSEHNRVRVEPIPPIRGLIYSRDGELLADNRPSFSLELIPEQIEDREQTIAELQQFITISDEDIERFQKQVRQKRHFDKVPLRFNLNSEEVAALSVNRHRFPGVDVVARLNRYYPYKEQLVHSLGYVGRIDEKELQTLDQANYRNTTHIGKLGVEKSYEDILHGSVGYQQVEVNAQGRIIRVLDRNPPQAGNDLHLTIDLSLQQEAIKSLDGRKGSIVAMDVDTGEILAMVSAPGYDPNLFVNGIDRKSYKALISSKKSPLINRSIQGKYPPGSTVKPFLGLAALELNKINPADTVWCPGWYQLKGVDHKYRDWKKTGHGHTNLSYSIVQSCDVFYYSLAFNLGINRIHAALSEFGFGQKSGVDIGGENSALMPSREWKRGALGQPWYQGETLIVGIGQGYMLATPLQLARATAILANGGRKVIPHLVKETTDPIKQNTQRLFTAPPETIDVKKEANWQYIVKAMRDVVHGQRGTARRSGMNAEYEFAGKTGTAQVVGIAQDAKYDADNLREEFHDHAWFIAFAPVEDPKIALAILVENGGSGSRSAAPIARQLLDHYLLDKES